MLKQLLDHRWADLLEPSLHLIDKLDVELDFENCVPTKNLIFRAFDCNPKDVSVVIFGQDPYPNEDHAMGLAFSVSPEITPLPASLRNIYTEMRDDIGTHPIDGDLTFLQDQGVMLLNRGLTLDLPSGKVNPLWLEFTNDVAVLLASLDVVGIFWGNKAQELAGVFPETHRILGVHPSPLSAYRGFFGSKPFSRTNEILSAENKEIINWAKQ